MEERNRGRLALTGAFLSAVAASMCCIMPVVAVVVGVGGFAASALFERWRPYLLAVTFGLLALGFYLTYRRPRREACEPGSLCARAPIGGWNRVMLGVVTMLVIVLAAFPYYSAWVTQVLSREKKPVMNVEASATAHVTFNVKGMDCGGCAALLEKNLSQLPGIYKAEVSFERKQAALDYDPRAINLSEVAERIEHFGFKVAFSTRPDPKPTAFP